MSNRDEIIHTYRCTDPFGESCSHDCKECEKELSEMLDDYAKEVKADAIDEFVEKLIPRLTDAIYTKDVPSMVNLINDVRSELKEQKDDCN